METAKRKVIKKAPGPSVINGVLAPLCYDEWHSNPRRAKLRLILSFFENVEDSELILMKKILQHILEPTRNVLYVKQETGNGKVTGREDEHEG